MQRMGVKRVTVVEPQELLPVTVKHVVNDDTTMPTQEANPAPELVSFLMLHYHAEEGVKPTT